MCVHICVHTYAYLPLLQSDDTSDSKKDIGAIPNDLPTVRILMPLIKLMKYVQYAWMKDAINLHHYVWHYRH